MKIQIENTNTLFTCISSTAVPLIASTQIQASSMDLLTLVQLAKSVEYIYHSNQKSQVFKMCPYFMATYIRICAHQTQPFSDKQERTF